MTKKNDASQYVEQAALLLDLQLRDEYRNSAIANFKKIQAIAKLVNEFPLPQDIEAAPKFEP